MPYLILFVLAFASAALGVVSTPAYFAIWALTIGPMFYLIFRPSYKPLPKNTAFWLMTACVVNFTASLGGKIGLGETGWALAMGFFALYWAWRTMSLIAKMDGLDDDTPYNRYDD